ncbi:DUF6531 domain-containing protein [Streptomyces litchfieldiae]|uniref:DUF6531 domain-containing protein n=1 Tax=Streptomyces litchfieldiae TaxID=3075543 RepID=A0ABU2MW88_9ACTN|nr:DUF6531 domain-containing protein [Streptomyces sp. DSM 44938]MDT0344829.1 DUF6531 domain-containing protein [Streptomyces sp. DSM 44938]
MARASDWSPVDLDSDPAPGEPEDIRELADSLQIFADDVGEALGKIRGMAGDSAVQDWAGLSADRFRAEFEGVPENLSKLQTSYDICARALHGYWPRLEIAQGMADRALDSAIAAQADLAAAQVQLGDAEGWVGRAGAEAERLQAEGDREGVEPPDEDAVRAATRDHQAAQEAAAAAQSQVGDAEARLAAARQLAQDALALREEAARTCAQGIEEASDAGIQNRSWWENLVRWFADAWDTIVSICKVIVAVLGVIVMIIGGPLAWVVVAAAAVVLVDSLIKFAQGKGSLLDVAFAALDCIPGLKGLTTLGGLAAGLRGLAGTGLRGQGLGARGLGQAGRGNSIPVNSRAACGDPVDMATGVVLMSTTDVELPGVLPLVVERHHISGYRDGRSFGRSWASTLDQRLVLDDGGARLHTADGMILDYPVPLADPDTPVLPVEGPRWGLAWDGLLGSPLTVRQGTGQTLHFGPVPGRPGGELPLLAVTDRNGNRVDIRHDPAGHPAELIHSGGYRVGVTTTGRGRVTELRLLSDPEQPTLLRYGYDAGGNLVEIRNSSGVPLRFFYDEDGRLSRWEDRNGHWYAYAYDEAGRCVHSTGTDRFLEYRYAYDPVNHRTTATNSLGHDTVFQFNDSYQLIAETDPQGHTSRKEWDRYDRVAAMTDPQGRTQTFEYDERGNVAVVTRPDGLRTRAEYNAFGQQTAVVEADGAVWRQEFDDRGNLVTLTDPAGATTRYTYDDRGRVTSATDPSGHVTTIETDAAGLVRTITDPLGGTVTHEYDAFGRPVTITDPLGAAHHAEWSVEGRLLRSTDPEGGTETWTWDPEGNCLSHTSADGATTRYEYGPFDLPTVEIRPDGARYVLTYDTELVVTRVTNPQGLTWRYDHDAAGRLISETDFDGRTHTYTHDPAGRLLSRTNSLGQTVTFTYDLMGEVTEKNADGRRTTFTLDPYGRVLRAVGPDADVVQERDVLGRIVGETVNGATVTHTYNAVGQPLSRVTPSGHRTTFTYDAAGAPATVTSAGRPIRFERDSAGREIRRSIGERPAIGLTQEWDVLSQLTAQSLTARTRPLWERSFTYRPGRRLAALADSRHGTTTFTHDADARVTGVNGPGWTETYEYDPAGNQTRARWPGEAHDTEAAGDRDYTGLRLTRAGGIRYEYDGEGRVILRQRKRLSKKPDTWRYTWDAENHLTDVITPDGSHWHYLYDPFDRRVAKQHLDADGTVPAQTTFTWSGSELIEESTTRPEQAERTTLTWDYDQLRPLAQTERTLPGTDEAPPGEFDARFYAIVTDLVGAPTELIDEAGDIAWTARRTLWGADGPDGGGAARIPLKFPGQYADPETGWYYNYHRHYDPATARYTSPDPLGLAPSPNPVAYVANPQEFCDPTGLAPCCPSPHNRPPHNHHQGGRPDGEIVFTGHGVFLETPRNFWDRFRRKEFTVPQGTSIAVYTHHGGSIVGATNGRIQTGNIAPYQVFGPGQRIPNYHLLPPDSWRVPVGNPVTVTSPTQLSSLVGKNMGTVHWAACMTIQRDGRLWERTTPNGPLLQI